MTIWGYVRDHLLQAFLLFCAMGFSSAFLLATAVAVSTVLFLNGVLLTAIICGCVLDYQRRRRFYREAAQNLQALDQKYLLGEMLPEADFCEGSFFCDALQECGKSAADFAAEHRRQTQEYREYIETWVHEIKTPIAAAGLLCENHRSPLTRSLEQELFRIRSLVDQALYYARSSSVEKDYLLRPYTLQSLVDRAVRERARLLIRTKFSIQSENLNLTVYTDIKWITFILGQMLENSIQYRSAKPALYFSGKRLPNAVLLCIRDNGIGIPQKDLPRVFEKGFTGENGRRFHKSTGIGLYLCRQLCSKMGLSLSIESGEWGTALQILFPTDSRIDTAKTKREDDESVRNL